MTNAAEKIESEIRALTDVEKLHLVDVILSDLDRPDPEIDRIWADEARKDGAPTSPAKFSPYRIRM